MLLTFGVLGWSYYEMSGGADFVPAPSEKVAIFAPYTPATEPVQPAAETNVVLASATAETPAQEDVTRADTSTLMSISLPDDPLPDDPVENVDEVAPLDLREVAGARVNMRQGPGTNYAVLDTLPRGTSVEVLEVDAEGWAKLRVMDNDQIGWMAERLLTDGDA